MFKKPNGFASKNTGSYRTILAKKLERQHKGSSQEGSRSSKTIFNFSDCLLNGIDALWRQKLMCDVLLIVEGKNFLAHKLVLATCSDFFFEKFSDGKDKPGSNQIELEDVKASTIYSILDCMYTGKISLTPNTIRDVLSTATMLGFLGIHEACEEYLIEHLTTENCFLYMDIASTYDLSMLSDKCLENAARNFQHATKGSEFRYVPVEQLILLLKRNDLNVKNEYDVFERMLAWIETDKQRRIQYATELLANVRLPLMTPSEIIDKVESVRYLMDIPDCDEMVKDALHYHCMPCRQTLLQTSRTEPRIAYSDDCLVVVGGAPRLKTDRISCDILVLDINNPDSRWELTACLPEPRHHHAVAVMNGFLYITGGEITNNRGFPSNSAFRYDPRHDTWLQIASMKHRRESFQMVVLNDKLYAVGGRLDKKKSLSSVEVYDPSRDAWALMSPLSTPKQSFAATTHNGKIYVVGGSESKIISSRVERYCPSNDSWEIRKPINLPRFYAHLTSYNNNLYLIGGATVDIHDHLVCVKNIERYTPSTDTWVVLKGSNLPNPRSEFGCTIINNKIYIAGGYDWDTKVRLAKIDCFDLITESWSTVQSFGKKYTGLALCSMRIYNFNFRK
ncbi:hypothetical protein LOTGIDRAFT_194339 [Lottia gigantea]|uniref:BTB domain-containing protein n=1 Tax=Lottia gigantea TaxID=225164 RepID=V3Z9J7_LOTGI|nr:hypothetical protein LOTGIDRAFT_194339 [Lottia gigantea]ESO87598.1 hypothetical protein LOTGIDRAFT_194339 [Lottia gigantea]